MAVKSPHILLASSNPNKLKANLVAIIEASAIEAIDTAIKENVAQLFVLGRTHQYFARRQLNSAWRQKVSRSYYGAYNISRAVRLCSKGEYSTDSSDHSKIGDLPNDFNRREQFGNRLSVLRADRNLCDYDHTAKTSDLSISVRDAIILVDDFLNEARRYLVGKRIAL